MKIIRTNQLLLWVKDEEQKVRERWKKNRERHKENKITTEDWLELSCYLEGQKNILDRVKNILIKAEKEVYENEQ